MFFLQFQQKWMHLLNRGFLFLSPDSAILIWFWFSCLLLLFILHSSSRSLPCFLELRCLWLVPKPAGKAEPRPNRKQQRLPAFTTFLPQLGFPKSLTSCSRKHFFFLGDGQHRRRWRWWWWVGGSLSSSSSSSEPSSMEPNCLLVSLTSSQ